MAWRTARKILMTIRQLRAAVGDRVGTSEVAARSESFTPGSPSSSQTTSGGWQTICGFSVSNLVRNVLEEVFTVVENVSEEVGDFFEDVVEEAGGVRERIRNQQRAARRARRGPRRSRGGERSDPADVEEELRRDEAAEAREAGRRSNPNAAAESRDNVLGWQPIVLNQAADCAGCCTRLEPGANAFMAISRDGELGKLVCPGCGAPS